MRKRRVRKFIAKTYKHYLAIVITLGFIACFYIFPHSLGRLIESCRDFGLSAAYYFCEILGFENVIKPTVQTLPKFPFFAWLPKSTVLPSAPIPENFEEFKEKFSMFGRLLVDKENLAGYSVYFINALLLISKGLMLAVPFILVAFVFVKRYLKTENNDYDKDSRALILWKRYVKSVYNPIKTWVKGFLKFIKENPVYFKIWLALWLFYFNAISIVLEFFAFYMFFIISFDFIHVYVQIYKLFIDLWSVLTFFPLWAWICIVIAFIVWWRRKIGYARLKHCEMKNRGFINSRPIVLMVCGTMGKKKTTAITDMALSEEAILRDKAFEKILENDLKFPCFPWVNLENEIKRCMEYRQVYNLATMKKWVQKKKRRFSYYREKEKLFNYDYERYGYYYDDKLKIVDVWNVIEIYAQLYFIYVIQSSLIISNYSVRADFLMSEIGNFPMWDMDFFKRDSRFIDSISRHAHILDFDALRLGKKVLAENPLKDSFEFGVVVITEVGKERGNSIENQEKKKKDDVANQKNDLFNVWLKMVRHSATVDNYPFVKVITDEQRPESWGADARDLCDIVHIKESGETRLLMPFFTLSELLNTFIFGRFISFYYEYRYTRSDNTLLMHLIKSIVSRFHKYYIGIYNTFGCCTLRVQTESGTQDGILEDKSYYLMSKKIYSKRFATDCFSEFYTEKTLRSAFGINDIREYVTERATFEELKQQNSYFINDLIKTEENDIQDGTK